MLTAALLSLVLPGWGELRAGRGGAALFASACALVAWSGDSWGLIVLAHLCSAWVAACLSAQAAAAE